MEVDGLRYAIRTQMHIMSGYLRRASPNGCACSVTGVRPVSNKACWVLRSSVQANVCKCLVSVFRHQ